MAEDSEGKRLLGSGNLEAYARGSFGCDVKDIFKADLRSHERRHLEGSCLLPADLLSRRAPATVKI